MAHDASESSNHLPVPKWFLDEITDPILFINLHGTVVYANDQACYLLNIKSDGTDTIAHLIDMKAVEKRESTSFFMNKQHDKNALLQVKSIKAGHLYCLFLQPLNEEKDHLYRTLNQLMSDTDEGMVIHDNGQIIDCDRSFANMFGYSRELLVKKQIHDIIHSKHYIELNPDQHENRPYIGKGRKCNGETIYLEISPQPFPFEDKMLSIIVVRDVTERIINEQHIEFMAYYDELTDLPNRNFFHKTLSEAMSECKEEHGKLAVHFMDIDYFKQINDTLGYQFGDQLLKACANRLKGLLDSNNFIARMSGDEFLILQRNITTEEDAEHFAENIIAAFQEPIRVEGFELYTSVSIGISLFPENGSTPNDLIKHADSAMYVIKEKQRNHYKLFESSITENFKEMLTIENELHKAIKEKQFSLHYQPQIDIKQKKLIGFEALLRWNHPKKGNISPNIFIPLAEKTGLIKELGEWVVEEACRQNKKWQDKGYPPVKVSVNMSVKQFLQKNLVEKVGNILEKTNLEPKYLEMEITESMAMANEEYILETLSGLHKLGIQVSIDDFGTGYSSLKYISQFPLCKLKIDQLFIREGRGQNEAIVKWIINMSHSLNMKVVAEGVETKEQLEFLKNEKCDEMQGFYFSKPVCATKAESFFSRKYAI
ncbi:sensor domain-containing protein [Salirhabdus salicampi]|uniref:sensor domain-containing protein n=1 Tax=Salirhabdus salicampi TaxID=476102 RepID=UPI0020C1D92B|nr:EAL domain-containing protein [Salirhabdus salicampi]MCP8615995.1 EAL domain-containing protein [Salirhabdus salicampi]